MILPSSPTSFCSSPKLDRLTTATVLVSAAGACAKAALAMPSTTAMASIGNRTRFMIRSPFPGWFDGDLMGSADTAGAEIARGRDAA